MMESKDVEKVSYMEDDFFKYASCLDRDMRNKIISADSDNKGNWNGRPDEKVSIGILKNKNCL